MTVELPTTRRLLALVVAVAMATSMLIALPGTHRAADAAIPYVDTERISGSDPVTISIAVSKRLFANNAAEAVILARKDKFPDALAVAAVAAEFNGPILFNASNTLESSVRAEIQRVLAAGKSVYLMGGTAALSTAVESALDDLGYRTPRFGGTDRIHTARLAAQAIGPGPNQSAILVRAFGSAGQDNTQGWPDSVSCGGYAANTSAPTPILLTNHDKPGLAPNTKAAIQQMGIKRVIICGGTAAVPQGAADELANMGVTVVRYAGQTRVSTATDIAKRLWGYSSSNGHDYVLVNGWGTNFAFGIVASQISADKDAPILLVDRNEPTACASNTLSKDTLCYLASHTGTASSSHTRVGSLTLVGSTTLVSDGVFEAAAKAGNLPKDTQPPAVPADVTATDKPEDDGKSVTVAWKASADPEGSAVRYRVYYKPDEGDELTKANATAVSPLVTGTSFSVGGLTAGTAYEFAVEAVDAFGNASALSTVVVATPTDEVPAAPATAPNVANGPTGIDVSWIAAKEADANGYRVQRKQLNAEQEPCDSPFSSWADPVAVSGKNTTKYTDTTAAEGTAYCFRYGVTDTTGNASGYSPAVKITRSPVQEDTTAPTKAPEIIAVNYDAQRGLVGSSAASRSQTRTFRVDVKVPAGAFQAAEEGRDGAVRLLVNGTARTTPDFGITGKDQVVSIDVSLNPNESGQNVPLQAVLVDPSGNGGPASTEWAVNQAEPYLQRPVITSVDGTNTDPAAFRNMFPPVVGANAPAVNLSPAIEISNLDASRPGQRLTLFVNRSTTFGKSWCVIPNQIGTDSKIVVNQDAGFTLDLPFAGSYTFTASVQPAECGSGESDASLRSGDSNDVTYLLDTSGFGAKQMTPADGGEEPYGFTNFKVVFNRPANGASTLTLRDAVGNELLKATNDGANDAAGSNPSEISFTKGDLGPGVYSIEVDATAAVGGQTFAKIHTFTNGVVHHTSVDAAVNAAGTGPAGNSTLVIDQAAPTGNYVVYVNGSATPSGQVQHTQGGTTPTRQAASTAFAAGATIEWTYDDPSDNRPAPSGKQADGSIPTTPDVATLGLRNKPGGSSAFRLDGVTTASGGGKAVYYVPTTTSGFPASTTFNNAPVLAGENGVEKDITNAAVRAWDVRYFVEDLTSGNRSPLVQDGTLRKLNSVDIIPGLGHNGAVGPGDLLFLNFSGGNTSLPAAPSPSPAADGGIQIRDASGGATAKDIDPKFGVGPTSSTATGSGNQLQITFGNDATVGGSTVTRTTLPNIVVFGRTDGNWLGLNWAFDQTTGHAVLLPPSAAQVSAPPGTNF